MHTWKIYLLPVCDDEFEERKKEKKKKPFVIAKKNDKFYK